MFVAVIIQADSGVRLCSLLGTMVKKRRHGQSCGGEDRTETDMEAGLLEQYQCWNTGVSVLEHSQRNVIMSFQTTRCSRFVANHSIRKVNVGLLK